MTRTPFDLAIDHGGDRFAVSGDRPRLSWKLSSDAPADSGHELEAEVDGIRLPGPRRVVGHRFVVWPWAPLRSGQRVAWRVRSASTAAEADWSDWAAFEVGLLDADWTASWISPVDAEDPGQGRRPASLLSTEFVVTKPVRSARLYATALGLYTAEVNGTRVGTVELAPGSTSYDRTLYAQASDVTASLRLGENNLSFELSDGWYRGQVGAFRMPAGWGTVLGLRVELHLEHTDGTRRIVRSDDAWVERRSSIVRADLMDGQTVDLTVVDGASTPVRVGVVDAPAIDWSPAPPVRVVESRAPRLIREIEPGVWIFDFGQNASGWVKVSDLGPEGTMTTVEYGEFVDVGGELSTTHLDSERPGEPPVPFRQYDEVITGARGNVFEPRHTVHGFQYARITRHGAPLDTAAVTMQIVHTDLRRTGTFSCSDADLNRLHEIAEWSFRGNAVDVPTDCPTRERLAWTGDYQIFAPTATRLYDVLGFSRKWLRSVRDDQLDDGRIANFSPDGRRIKHHLDDQFAMMTGSAGWGDAIVAVPWELYECYGDERVLAENWDAMVRWVEWALGKARTERHHARASHDPEPFEQYLWDGTFHWGEWTEPKERDADGQSIDPIKQNPIAWFMADKGEVGTAYLHRSAATLARVAAILGHHDSAARYELIAGQVGDAWRAAYLRPDGTTAADTQAAYVRALSFGLIPEQLRDAAATRLVELIRAADTHLQTGFLSTGDLLPVLCDTGHVSVAYELLLQRTAPSWLNMIDRGATTIWEDWNGIDAAGVAHESLNHYSKGAVIRFLHTHALGLRQAPGSIAWESIIIEPTPGTTITWASGSHESPQGLITVDWRIDDGEMHISAELPAGTSARIVFPDGTEALAESGSFSTRRRQRHPSSLIIAMQ